MKNQNTIKRITQKLLFVALILLLLPCFAFGASTSLPNTKVKATAKPLRDAKVKKSPLQKQGSTLVNPQNTKPVLRSAEITRLRIFTEADGRWYWEVTIKNTGNVNLDGQRVVVQGYKISHPQAQNAWIGASGSIIGGNLLPNQTRIIRRYWTRCCKTALLRVDLKDRANNTIFDTETSSGFTPIQGVPSGVDVKRIEWNDTTKTWQATVRNFSPHTLKLSVQGYLWDNAGTTIPVGGSTITIKAAGEASVMWLPAPSAKHGDILKVYIKLLLGNNNCNEGSNDCGSNGYMHITIPHSRTFY